MDLSFPGRVPDIDGRLPSPGDGVDEVSPGRSVTGCISGLRRWTTEPWTAFPHAGGGLSCPGDGVNGISRED